MTPSPRSQRPLQRGERPLKGSHALFQDRDPIGAGTRERGADLFHGHAEKAGDRGRVALRGIAFPVDPIRERLTMDAKIARGLRLRDAAPLAFREEGLSQAGPIHGCFDLVVHRFHVNGVYAPPGVTVQLGHIFT